MNKIFKAAENGPLKGTRIVPGPFFLFCEAIDLELIGYTKLKLLVDEKR